ncbi:hypothetical protein [Helicobacter himalayensis]|uniref:hypothetical protein n=1 Tax=Helicobacter himalayensis TaxID=1591088 RepID=UPI0008346527|nr:hypothetical protein [Helicobacter himalayensis]
MRVALILVPCAFILNACAPHYVYKEVKVPIKCDVPKREKPKNQGNITTFLKDILIYTEGLERDLAFCRGDS